MKREDLTKLGLEDKDVIDSIMALNGKDIEKHKTDAASAQADKTAIEAQLAEANKQIDAFKGMDVEGVKKAADEWKTKAEQAAKDAADQVAKVKFDSKLESALSAAKVKDTLSVMPHLKMDALKLNEDGSILGLKEQLETLKTSKDFLFESETPTQTVVTNGKQVSGMTDAFTAAMRKGAGLPEGK